MEKVQLRALRFVFNDFRASYSDLRSRAGRPLLYTERLKAILTEVFRIYLNVSPEYNRCILLTHSIPYNIRNTKCLEVPSFQTIKLGKNTFRYEAPKLWNMLENKFKSVTDLDSFKESINLWAGPRCMCSYCSQCILYKV